MDDTRTPAAASTAPLRTRDGIGTITLNRPERRNAFNWQLGLDLIASLERARSDPEVRVLVLTGAGRDFCVGADMTLVGSDRAVDQESRTLRGRSVEDDIARLTRASSLIEILLTFPKPTIAAVNGACAGAGLSIALACDMQVVDERAVFNTAFVTAGLSGDLGSAWLLTRAVGTTRARALLLDPIKLTASRALAMGLVTEVVDDLNTRVYALATKMRGQPAPAMTHAKENLLQAVTAPLSQYLPDEIARMVSSAHSDEARMAARAFVIRSNARAGRDGAQ